MNERKALNRVKILMKETFNIIDDNCYLNGREVEFNPSKPYIIVVGESAIGKSVYSREMSKYNKDIQYYSQQRLESVFMIIRKRAIKIIDIREVRL